MPSRKVSRGAVYVPVEVPKGSPETEWEYRGKSWKWVEDPDQTAALQEKRRRRGAPRPPLPAQLSSTAAATMASSSKPKAEPRTQPMPPWATQAKNVIGAATRVARALSQGKTVRATETAYNLRLAACDDCPYSTPEDLPVARRRCSRCGCFISKKAGLSTESCPAGKW